MFSTETTKLKSDLGNNGFPVTLNYFTGLPDANIISDPQLKVIFKSLMKKDATTKEKSLTDLHSIFDEESKESLKGEEVIQCWIQMFPKLVFDNSRSVRLLSVKIQGNYLKLLGGKTFSKYLKSCLPIWLSVVYDADKQISGQAYNLLVDSFGDKSRVDIKLWQIFTGEILQFIEAGLFFESKKTLSDERNTTDADAVLKHERVINSSLNLLNKLIILINQGNLEFDYKFDELLDNELLWESMITSFSVKTFNSSIANSYLVLIKSIFQEDQLDKGNQNKFCSQYLSSARSCFKHILKRFLKQIKLKSSNNSQSITYGSMILQFWGTLINLTKFNSLEGKKKPKENFWEISSNGETRLIDYIRLGPCNLDPIYYILLKNCLIFIIQHSNIDFNQSKLGESIIEILTTSFRQNRPIYKENALECLIGFIQALDPNLIEKVVPTLIESLNFTNPSRDSSNVNKKCIGLVADAIKSLDNKEVLKNQESLVLDYINNGTKIIEISVFADLVNKLKYDASHLINTIIENLSEIEDEIKTKRSFEVLTILVNKLSLKDSANENLKEFNSSVAMYMEKDTDYVIDYIFTIWDCNDDVNLDVVDDLVVKYGMLGLDSTNLIIQLLDKVSWEYKDLPTEIKNYVDGLISKSKTREEWQIIMKFIDSIFDEVLDSNDELELIDNFSTPKQITSENPKLVDLLSKSWSRNPKLVQSIKSSFVQESIWKYIETEIVDWKLIKNELPYIYSKLDEKLLNLPNINKDMLSVSNSMRQNIHLLEDSDIEGKSLDFKIIENFLRLGDLDVYYGLILCKYIEDYHFLVGGTDVHFEYTKPSVTYDFATAVEALINSSSDPLLSKLIVNVQTKGALQSYSARIFAEILENASENVSDNVLESYDFSTLLRSPIKLSILLSGLSNHLKSNKFDRIRNFVVSEILGVKSPPDGLKWLVLTINFLLEDFTPIPPHRLNMVVKTFEKWLESEYSYEIEFLPVRAQITRVMKYYQGSSEIVDELCERLISDNLDMIKISPNDSYELRYNTLKYGINKTELSELLFDENIIEVDNKNHNMVVHMCLEVFKRSLKSITIDGEIEKFIDLCLDTKFEEIKQICIEQLINKVNKKQQELVVNYQFDKDEEEIKLPEKLLSVIKNYEYIEDDNSSTNKNLNYYIIWYLILIHFKDISYSIRNQYLSQIKSDNLLDKFLDIIFEIEQIDYKKIENSDEINESMNLELDLFVVSLYYLSCKYLGSEVQQWFNTLRNVQMKNHIEIFTKSFISAKLINGMLNTVEDNKAKLVTDVMNIKVNRVINEVRSIFEIDEQTMEMVIKIPTIFPLDNVVVEGPKKIGLKENEWKAWLLSSQRVISLTNGSILEAIEIFKRNVDLHFSGFEDCAICYSILHQDHSLPSKSCQTCPNKFHAACLYKWFKSSGSSTCPLCRSTFNFRKS